MAQRRRQPNPFYYGDLALDEAFTDRVEELTSLKRDMANGQNVALIAPRRYGKSSLVRRAGHELLAEDVLVAEVDLMKTPTKERLASHLARAIHDDLASPMFKARELALKVFESLRLQPTITYSPTEGRYSFSFTAVARDEPDIDETLERLFELPAQLAAEQGKGVVLYFDEFQEITEIDKDLPRMMRAVFQEQPDVSHVYAGSKRNMMNRLFNDKNEPFYQSAKVMEIGRIPDELFGEFIKERFDATDRGVSDATIDGLLAVTQGHPYATQKLASALWEEVPMGFSASVSDLDRALDLVLRSESARFTLLWDTVARTQRQLLQALAIEPGHVQSARYVARHGLSSASTTQKAAQALVAAELIAKRVDGMHAIVEPFLAEWITRYAS